MKTFARTALAAILMTGLAPVLTPASAQSIPAGQTCGGLLCDAGIVGTKVPVGPDGRAPSPEQMAAAEAADPHRLPCNDFLCRAFGQKSAAAAPPPAPVAAAPEAAPEPIVKHTRKRKKVAKADVPARTPAPTTDAAPAK